MTHLREVLRVADPQSSGISRVILWSGCATLDGIEDRPWLHKAHEPALDKGLFRRSHWSARKVAKLAQRSMCDVLWVPGCSYAGAFRPYVAMSRNMLPFEWKEMCRYGFSRRFLKFFLLRFSQSRTYRRSSGMIYLSEYARAKVGSVIGKSAGTTRVIPHGIEGRFSPSPQAPTAATQPRETFRLLYVSAVDLYKHQWNVVDAVALLQQQGHRVELTLIGPAFPDAEAKLRRAMDRFEGTPGTVRYLGAINHSELHEHYQRADIFVYASSCENLPNILLEAMACGKPIACSSRGPMPEVLRDGGVFFDPEKPGHIAEAVRQLLESPSLRAEKAALGLRYSREYSWERCARESFEYLAEVAAGQRSELSHPAI